MSTDPIRVATLYLERAEVPTLRVAKSFKVEVGQPIFYGKYKNKKGIIKGFKTLTLQDGRGVTTHSWKVKDLHIA